VARFKDIDWYDAPTYYDIIYDVGTVTEANFLEAVFRQYVSSGGRSVLEPACGTGRLVAELAGRGYNACGFDTNPSMLDHARCRLRRTGRRSLLKQTDMANFSFGRRRFDMAYCLVSSIRYLLTEGAARRHLYLVAQCLRPGGVYVVGLLLTDYADRTATMERWEETRGQMRVVCNVKTWPAQRRSRTARMRSRLTVYSGESVDRYESTWLARTYGPRQLRQLIAAEPRFELADCYTFDYDANRSTSLEDDRLDKVVVLRRRS
jgi:SAM-dependent methyltransferase